MATANSVSPLACSSCSEGRGWSRPGSQPTLTPFFGQDWEAEGGIQNWEKEEEKEKEKEEEKVAVAAGASMEEEAPDSPRDLLAPRRKAQEEGPTEVKLELHRLQSR